MKALSIIVIAILLVGCKKEKSEEILIDKVSMTETSENSIDVQGTWIVDSVYIRDKTELYDSSSVDTSSKYKVIYYDDGTALSYQGNDFDSLIGEGFWRTHSDSIYLWNASVPTEAGYQITGYSSKNMILDRSIIYTSGLDSVIDRKIFYLTNVTE